MEVEHKSKVVFGTGRDRQMFPMHMPYNRFGNNLKPIRGAPHLGPGCYDNEVYGNIKYDMDHLVVSNKGYTLGGRTARRFGAQEVERAPAPPTYQTNWTDPREFDPSYKPFSVGAQRFQIKKADLDVCPGPGAYEHSIKSNRKVEWHASFGGTPINLPEVKVQSTIGQNTEKLFSTKDEKRYHRRLAYLKLYY